ncbi:MAG: CTP synthase (glutamine hydrolyzing) [Candidatus Lernaella stagnicola]|nr:CTP synthase (glutamine hydrolyzing) [Candidatus Lernaella stagnicola]
MKDPEQFLTLEDVAERLKVSISTVRRWVKSGDLKALKVGNRGQYRISEEDLDDFLAETEVEPETTLSHGMPRRGREWDRAVEYGRKHVKYIITIGGVLSGLGKGIAAASMGKLLASRLKIVPVKADGYLNTDPGTMNPIEHGEVFVLDDGGEVDMDFGHYERFLGVTCKFSWNLTMGKVYKQILERERAGDYLGQTVQLIPHVTDSIKEWFYGTVGLEEADIGLIEIGGTIGDMENELYIEACRQLRQEVGRENIMVVLLTYVPIPYGVGEHKSKPTQQAAKLLNERGLSPDVIIGRSPEILPDKIKTKIALFCNIDQEAVISGVDVDTVYRIPLCFEEEGLTEILHKRLGIYSPPELSEWRRLVDRLRRDDGLLVRVAICGKYTDLHDSYASVIEASRHSGAHIDGRVEIAWLDTTDVERGAKTCEDALKDVDAVIVPGGFGTRGIEGKIAVIEYCREANVPFLGICYGMQLAVVEYARNVLGLTEANTMEVADEGAEIGHPVVCILPEQINILLKGGTMRLGGHDIVLQAGSRASETYGGETLIRERFRHRYEVNPEYVAQLEEAGLVFSGHNDTGQIKQVMELPDHAYFMGCQFHPELRSKLEKPAPLFRDLIRAAYQRKNPPQHEHGR